MKSSNWLLFMIALYFHRIDALPISLRSNLCMQTTDVAIIGGGVGGLISATILSRSGVSVDLYEKNAECGGRMNSNTLQGYRFDTGPSLLLLPDVYRKTFVALGESIDDHVDLQQVEPYYRCFFEVDSTFAEITPNSNLMRATADQLEANGYTKFVDYMKVAGDFLKFGLPAVIEERPDFRFLVPFIVACIRAFPLLSHYTMLKTFFASEKMRALMSFQDLYIGLSPYEAPAVFSLLQALELERGIYYPKGGFTVVARALENIAKKNGVRIHTNTELGSVIIGSNSDAVSDDEQQNDSSKNGFVEGIQIISSSSSSSSSNKEHKTAENSDKTISAQRYIFNIDAPEVESRYIPDALVDKRSANGRPSCGIVQINLAFNRRLECLSHHTLFLSKDYEKSWKTVEEGDRVGGSRFNPETFNFYVHAPVRTDDTVCPQGHDAVTVLVPVQPLAKTVSGDDGAVNRDDGNKIEWSGDDLKVVRDAVLRRLQQMEDVAYAQGIRSNEPVLLKQRRAHSSSSSSHTAHIAATGTTESVESERSTAADEAAKVDKAVARAPRIEDHIVFESIRHPSIWRQEYGLYRGSAFGLAHPLDQLSLLRPRLRHPNFKNVYRVGASTRPGNGVPLVMIGARLTAEAVLRDIQSSRSI